MRTAWIILIVSVVCLAFVPNVPTQVTFYWNSQPGVDLFKLYQSPDITVPFTNWTVLTNTAGTNAQISIQMMPGTMWFYLTASNFWGESGPSVPLGVPPIPGVTNLNIRKGP